MRLTTFILIVTIMQVSAAGFAQKVSLSEKNVPIRKVLEKIRIQTGYDFLFANKTIKYLKSITIQVKDAELPDVLDELFKGQALAYKIEDKSVIIKPKSPSFLERLADRWAAIDVRGVVTDSMGKPLQGATVKVKGSTIQVNTNAQGEFFISDVAETAVLVISYTGYKTREIRASKEVGPIKLEIVVSELTEVTISTGYQKLSKERFVGSAVMLDSTAYSRRAGMGILERLDGTVSGVLFDRKGGPPIQIRGISTLGMQSNGSAFAPLIIVDNFPYAGELTNLNPNDIKDITVLKDAAAASIWGSRGANGVIVITTKRGRYNQSLSISASSNVSIQEKTNLFYQPKISNADLIGVEQFLFNEGYYDSDLSNNFERPVVSPAIEWLAKEKEGAISQEKLTEELNKLKSADYRRDLNKYIYRNVIQQQQQLSISGGSPVMNYLLSAGFNQNSSTIKGSKGNYQYTLNSVNTLRPFKNFEVEVGINLGQRSQQDINGSLSFVVPSIYPYAQLFDGRGNQLALPVAIRQSYIDTAGHGQLLDWNYRPLEEISRSDNNNTTLSAILNLGLSYQLTDWLKIETRYQYQKVKGDLRNYYSQDSYYARDMINKYSQFVDGMLIRNLPMGGILDVGNTNSLSNNFRAQVNINKEFSEKHQLTAIIAGEISGNKGTYSSNRFYGYNDDISTYATGLNYEAEYPAYDNLTGNLRIGQGARVGEDPVARFVSILSNINYTYDDKYTFYLSGRRDGANVFGARTNNKWKPLWSAGGSWDISREAFYHLQWLPALRLKASYGYMGNVDNLRSALASMLYSDPAEYTRLPTAVLVSPPNPDLRWEEVGMANIGVDFSALNNRISGSVEWFRKKSNDVIAPTPVDPTSGVNEFVVNVASLKGKGVDITLNSRNTTGLIKWGSSVGLSYNKTIVTRYYNGGFKASEFIEYGINPVEGQLAWGISSYRFAGLDPLNGDPQGILNGEVSKDYSAIFNDSLRNQVFHGSSLPLYSGFFSNIISWKNISISSNITYRLQYYFRKTSINYASLFKSWDGHPDFYNRWQKPGDEAHTIVPSMVYPYDTNRDAFFANSEANVKRGDHIRLQDVRIQYTLTKGNKPLFFNNLQCYLYVNNLNIILWRKDKSIVDPDYSRSNTPQSKSWTFGLNFNF
ncbi:TonB-linked SusC/RagA family outer membrane protein [Pedobacter sp. AK017]|uniref:SusC/RagA family TonB-linked outer membrane protein n=1 Tax=Pedobacter sp. AK017 TaxID=2723073 RepID=UPI00161249FF|nr:SusC/RagA family TonB-linked outer membrane protein [Pedobacter sp. AK017]MBB5441321.1 TonB-linked SusC/RagA family outer membrane protein [Pedobacter sp. AK017]